MPRLQTLHIRQISWCRIRCSAIIIQAGRSCWVGVLVNSDVGEKVATNPWLGVGEWESGVYHWDQDRRFPIQVLSILTGEEPGSLERLRKNNLVEDSYRLGSMSTDSR